MASHPPRNPRSYDEITRRTVPEPDSSFRPSPGQIAEADLAHREQRLRAQLTDQERMLYDRVAEVVLGSAYEDVGFDLDGATVTLHGRVHDPGMIDRLEDRVRRIPGVEQVVNRLVIGV